MKTKLKTNLEKTSFRLDVIFNGEFKQYYFNDQSKAIEFQNKLINK